MTESPIFADLNLEDDPKWMGAPFQFPDDVEELVDDVATAAETQCVSQSTHEMLGVEAEQSHFIVEYRDDEITGAETASDIILAVSVEGPIALSGAWILRLIEAFGTPTLTYADELPVPGEGGDGIKDYADTTVEWHAPELEGRSEHRLKSSVYDRTEISLATVAEMAKIYLIRDDQGDP